MGPPLIFADSIPFTTTIVGVITASATLAIAIGGVITAITVLVPILRQSRKIDSKVDEVHTIVNQQRTDMQRYQNALILALQDAGIKVPTDQSQPIDESPDIKEKRQ